MVASHLLYLPSLTAPDSPLSLPAAAPFQVPTGGMLCAQGTVEAGLVRLVEEHEASLLAVQIPAGSKGLSPALHGLLRSCR